MLNDPLFYVITTHSLLSSITSNLVHEGQSRSISKGNVEKCWFLNISGCLTCFGAWMVISGGCFMFNECQQHKLKMIRRGFSWAWILSFARGHRSNALPDLTSKPHFPTHAIRVQICISFHRNNIHYSRNRCTSSSCWHQSPSPPISDYHERICTWCHIHRTPWFRRSCTVRSYIWRRRNCNCCHRRTCGRSCRVIGEHWDTDS